MKNDRKWKDFNYLKKKKKKNVLPHNQAHFRVHWQRLTRPDSLNHILIGTSLGVSSQIFLLTPEK